MIPHIPGQRRFKTNASKPFNDLVAYIEAGQDQSPEPCRQLSGDFANVIDYATAPTDQKSGAEKCIAIRTHGVTGIATASLEMNTVAQKNTRCVDPVYHIILSWPEHEQPAAELIFDSAEHALDALGLGAHQYVLAIHGNTDNRHCHISVNRIHPRTFRSHNVAWAHRNLHRAARESEIKHGWSHDNGIFAVEVDEFGKKHVVPSIDRADALVTAAPRVHRELERDELLPVWHDPDSLDSWLKTKVTKALKPALAELSGWQALHAWLSDYDITLKDSGGGGLRLHATSAETGEILDLAASKGLRLLKRQDLEQRWGPFMSSHKVACIVPDLSHLTPQQIAKGVAAVLAMVERPPAHVLLARQEGRQTQDEALALMSEVVTGSEPDRDTVQGRPRDEAQRAERKAQRAAARLDLRQCFAQYRSEVRHGDARHFTGAKALQAERSLALANLRAQSKAAKRAISQAISPSIRLISHVEIDAESLRRKLQTEADFQEKSHALRVARTLPLSWRAWLLAQAGLGDQAALSALRSIVYQAQRDAKRDTTHNIQDSEAVAGRAESHAQQYKEAMARLLEEEKKEAAIRSAHSRVMRPYEADALLVRYSNITWRVTGNGNVQYRDQAGVHLFTDRGNRVTFDRERVLDDEIRLALAHAQHKFGLPLTLTGADSVFTERMARLADDMGILILNPELRAVIEIHRLARQIPIPVLIPAASSQPVSEVLPELITPVSALFQGSLPAKEAAPAPAQPLSDTEHEPDSMSSPMRADPTRRHQRGNKVISRSEPAAQAVTEIVANNSGATVLVTPDASNTSLERAVLVPTAVATAKAVQTPHERLRAMVLAINPHAKFVTPLDEGRGVTYFGKVVASLGEAEPGIAQFNTKLDAFILHPRLSMGVHEVDDVIEVQYKSGDVTAKSSRGQGKGGRGD
jgi:Relaxase/Mobilisation nuclease domain/Large polyvalent protein-associated domain 7